VVDLDIDISGLLEALDERALQFLASGKREEIERGIEFLNGMLKVREDARVAYNIACGFALLGEKVRDRCSFVVVLIFFFF